MEDGEHPAKAGLLPPAARTAKRRSLGILAGEMTLPADVDAPLPDEVLDASKGR
jgi:hypothetical protein